MSEQRSALSLKSVTSPAIWPVTPSHFYYFSNCRVGLKSWSGTLLIPFLFSETFGKEHFVSEVKQRPESWMPFLALHASSHSQNKANPWWWQLPTLAADVLLPRLNYSTAVEKRKKNQYVQEKPGVISRIWAWSATVFKRAKYRPVEAVTHLFLTIQQF